MARKILTIGITINLENYENLRLEVQGEVGPDGNTEEIIAFLDGMLTRLGHGDQVTAERVEAYRRRVLAAPGSGEAISATIVREARREPAAVHAAPAPEPPEAAPAPREPVQAEARQEPQPTGEVPPATVRVTPEGRPAKPAVKAPARAAGPAPPAPPAQAPERKAGAPSAAAGAPEVRRGPVPPAPQAPRKEAGGKPEKTPITEGEVACESCGLSITRNQEKLSLLLTGKSLCKKCMNPP
jgi:hypothetical protein